MKLVYATLVFALIAISGRAARAECNCLAVAGDVSASVQGAVADADGLYVRGDFKGALKLYADAYAAADDSVLLYAQAMCHWQLGAMDDAEAMFVAYIDAGGDYAARAKGQLEDVRAGVAAGGVGGVVGGAVGGVVGGVGGVVGGVSGEVDDDLGAGGAVGGAVGVVGGVTAKPKKVAKKASMLLGVVAVVAIGAVAIQGIYAGLKDDIDPVTGVDTAKFNKGFALGAGLSGVVMLGTAFYLSTLTVAGSAACAVTSRNDPSPPTVGLAGGLRF